MARTLQEDSRGRPFLVVSVLPKALTYAALDGGVERVLRFEPVKGPRGATFDVLGVKLGMGLAEAEAVLGQALSLDRFQRREGRAPEGGPLSNFVVFEEFNGQVVRERIVLYFDGNDISKPLAAVGRWVRWLAPDAMVPVQKGVFEKYGPPASPKPVSHRHYWAADPVTKARFGSGIAYDDACGHGYSRGFFDPSGTRLFSFQFLRRSCGEVLSVRMMEDEIEAVLTDSRRSAVIMTVDKERMDAAAARANRRRPRSDFEINRLKV